jgi:radical S-adenosyl methionine domain-containing protein 2
MSAILNNQHILLKTIVINYHITEKCNYNCSHCFAKYDLEKQFHNEIHHDLVKVKTMLQSVYHYFHNNLGIKTVRLNFAGGEPMIVKNFNMIVQIAKEIGFQLSLITNGSKLTQKFIKQHIKSFAMVGVSIDSFDNQRNLSIGRVSTNGKLLNINDILNNLNLARTISPKLDIKINTVITQDNFNEKMAQNINTINPTKWKIFKVLPFNGQKTLSDIDFHTFIDYHKSKVNCSIYMEDNDDMKESYIMIDPLGRFYQNEHNHSSYNYSSSILNGGAKNAFSQIKFHFAKFNNRYIA